MSDTTPADVSVRDVGTAVSPHTIVLFGPESLLHDALRRLIETCVPGAIVNYVTDERHLLEATGDLVLFDIDLHTVTDERLDEITRLMERVAPKPILLLSAGAEPDVLQRLLRDGVAGVVPKSASCDTLLEAIDAVSHGKVWLQRDLLTQTFGETSHSARRVCAEAPRIAQLTQREREMVVVACSGLTNRQIASRLNISEATVRHHLSAIFAKLGVANRGELIVFAYRHGLNGEIDRSLC